jgi:hypothetical protein
MFEIFCPLLKQVRRKHGLLLGGMSCPGASLKVI